MSIQPFGTGGVGMTQSLDPSAFISPDSLMAYCEARMSSLDSQMKTAFAQQKKSNDDSQALTWLNGCISACSQGGIAQGPDAGRNHAGSDLVRAFEVTINKVGRDTDLGKKLIAQQHAFMTEVGGNLQAAYNDGSIWKDPPSGTPSASTFGAPPTKPFDDGAVNTVKAEAIQAYSAQIKSEQSDLNGGAELNMINLQAIMSQRQTAIQLTTNLIQSLGDSSNKIAANIGH